jgi:hypothetical protein
VTLPQLTEDNNMTDRSYVDTTDTEDLDVSTRHDTRYSTMGRVSAVFDDRADAERAVDWLRSRGVPNENISVLARHTEDTTAMAERPGAERVDDDAGSDVARGAGVGLAAGAGVGALFGLAAAFIPGIGPFITAGALAHALGAAGGGAVAGAIVGGTSGAVAGALSKWGLDQADANYYGGEVERGATFVSVDLTGTALSYDEVRDAFRRYNGRFSDTSGSTARSY